MRDDLTIRTPGCFGTGWCNAVFDLVNDAVFMHDPETGAILDVNRRAEEMFGASRDEMRASGVSTFSAGFPPYTWVEARAHFEAAASSAPQLFEWRARKRSGELFWVEVNIKKVTLGEISALVAVVRDITARKDAEEVARRREDDLRVAQRIAHVGSWAWVVGTEHLEASEEVCRIYGRDPRLPIPAAGSAEFRRHYTDEGWARRQAAFAKALADGQPWEREEEILRLDGTRRWVRFRGEPDRDEHGRTVKLRGTIQDITDQKRAEEALRDAHRRKDEFLGMLSHELRNPLAPIRHSAWVLRQAGAATARGARAVDVIERQTEHLTRLVDDLLDVTRVARGKIELHRIDLDLREVVLRAAEDFRALMDERGRTFVTDVPGSPVWANVDPIRLTQVLGNLLHNAAKFTRSGDRIAMSLEVAGADAEIRVRDTGAGIDRELLPTIFEPFVQGDRTLARTEGGLGLGLALVKGITELHGGRVRADSAGRGGGAEFVLALPLGPAPAAPRGRREEPRAQRIARRVLAVDDNRDAAESLAEMIRLLGHSAEVTYDGSSAIEKLRAGAFDVVLCDVGLPDLSGYDVARRLRAEGCVARLVAVTGYAQPDDVASALDAGFDAHVAKPCDAVTIERMIG